MCTTCRRMNLAGRVKKRDGTPVTRAQSMRFAHENGNNEVQLQTSADGSYAVPLPLQGRWYVYVNGCPAQPASIVVDVPAGVCTRNFRRTCDENGNPE